MNGTQADLMIGELRSIRDLLEQLVAAGAQGAEGERRRQALDLVSRVQGYAAAGIVLAQCQGAADQVACLERRIALYETLGELAQLDANQYRRACTWAAHASAAGVEADRARLDALKGGGAS